jgi:predicted nucleotidyltransferase
MERQIGLVLGAFDGVEAVYLFGSVAEGRARADSDVDLAVVPANNDAREHHLDMLKALASIGCERADLVFLDNSDLVLQFHAVRQNRPLYTSPGFSHGDYFSRTLRQYRDLEPLLRVRHAAYRRRALDG